MTAIQQWLLGAYVRQQSAEPGTVAFVSNAHVEGGQRLVHFVLLAEETTAETAFPFVLTHGTTDGDDFDGAPTFTDGVTLDGGDLIVPAGVSSFMIFMETTGDNDDTETYTIEVGGESASGAIVGTDLLLLQGPGDDGASLFWDYGRHDRVMTTEGMVEHELDDVDFPDGAMKFTSAGFGYLTALDDPALELYGLSNWTIEGYIKPTALATMVLLDRRNPSTGNGWQVVMNGSGALFIQAQGTFVSTPNGALAAGVKAHFAIVYDSGTATIYINGVEVASGSLNLGAVVGITTVLRVGRRPDAVTPLYYNGLMAQVRISPIARYTADFTPPAPFPIDPNEAPLMAIRKLHCILRPGVDGVWFVQNDGDHKPFGITTSVTQTSEYLRIFFSTTYNFAGTIQVTTDDDFQAKITAHSNLGLANATIRLFKDGVQIDPGDIYSETDVTPGSGNLWIDVTMLTS